MPITDDFDATVNYVRQILQSSGIPSDSVGFDFLAEAIALYSYGKPRALTDIYAQIADLHQIDSNVVPKRIAAIVRDYRKELCVNLDLRKPKLTPDFISALASYVKYGYYSDPVYTDCASTNERSK